jgi:two-component system OmpR family sensor kinase
MTLPIRVRLTLWYVFMLALTLLLFAGGLYAFVAREERQSIDTTLRERAITFVRAYDAEASEGSREKAAAEATRDFARGEGDVYVYDGTGKPIAQSDKTDNPASIPVVRAAFKNALAGGARLVTVDRETRCIVARLGVHYVVVITQSLEREAEALSRLRQAMAIAIPVALVVAAAIGYLLALRSLAPVSRMTEVASRIEAENLSERIAFAHPSDELGRLGTVLNALLERLERSFEQQKRLLADTSHELRTPVTIIRSEAEVTLSRERDGSEYRDALEIIRSEATRLTYLIDSVLLLARADAKQHRIANEAFSLNEVTEQSVHALRTVAERRGIDLSCGTNGPMPMRGDAELIRRMLLNLLDNAIKFTDRGGKVRLDVSRAGDAYLIRVSDTGRGVAPEAQPHIFDRFYRADRARSRDPNRETASGAGLGLSIARWIAEQHGGDVRLMQSSSAGSVFEATVRDVSG